MHADLTTTSTLEAQQQAPHRRNQRQTHIKRAKHTQSQQLPTRHETANSYDRVLNTLGKVYALKYRLGVVLVWALVSLLLCPWHQMRKLQRDQQPFHHSTFLSSTLKYVPFIIQNLQTVAHLALGYKISHHHKPTTSLFKKYIYILFLLSVQKSF